ncbi:hypothetical protein B0H11DRAFT_2242004 [Mycena galericulata]|nr:hypothetical protein B0H11DRAFT_2242004 [Mycena galericulata]
MGDNQEKFNRDIQTARAVYLETKSEFYAWKQAAIAKTWARVFPSDSNASGAAQTPFELPRNAFAIPPVEEMLSEEENPEPCVHHWVYDEDGNIGSVESMPLLVLKPTEFSGLTHPPYQFVTPASRNLMARMIDIRMAPFLPFPEDRHFPRQEYLNLFGDGVQWQNDQLDPDGKFLFTQSAPTYLFTLLAEEVIQYETVRRLHVEHHLSPEAIVRIMQNYGEGANGVRPLRLSNESGLIWEVPIVFIPRDMPDVIWGDGQPSSQKEPLPSHFAQAYPAANDIFAQVNNGRANFCFNLSCLHNECEIHVSPEWELYTPPVLEKDPRLTSEELFEQDGNVCGEDCFRLVDPDDMEDDDDVSVDALVLLRGILKLDPDMLPCDLAVLCKLRCRDVFFSRRRFIDDIEVGLPEEPEPIPIPAETKKKRKSRKKGLSRTKKTNFCERRWKGCDEVCGKPWRTGTYTQCKYGSRCPCRRARRECDPELCTACDARDLHVHHPQEGRDPGPAGPCHNMDLQRGRVEIRQSKYGLGAFAAEDIEKYDVIGEYVGELIHDEHGNLEPLGSFSAMVHTYSGLNYCFDLGTTTVDARAVGNPTRFLNDSKQDSGPGNPNCFVLKDHTVNGEKRLVIHAWKKIKKGAELTLTYGKPYWKEHNASMLWRKSRGIA